MAPSAGHLIQLLGRRKVLTDILQRVSRAVQAQAVLETAPVRVGASRQPLHPVALIRQSRRWLSGHNVSGGARQFSTHATTSSRSSRVPRAELPTSRVGSAVRAHTGRAPFASTLRPNLTGGTLGRSAGGYTVGAGRADARHFSHTPAAPAEVVQNVSQAVRAFFLSGKKAHFDGLDPYTGEKRWKAVSALEHEVTSKTSSLPKATPGSYIDFAINPTITAFSPLNNVAGFTHSTKNTTSLASEGLIDMLSADFSRAVKDMAIVLNDLERLSALGDLTITYQGSALRVHFPGCDAETVEKLCDELGVRRGIVYQDEDFDAFAGTEIALLFPFAPSKAPSAMSLYEYPATPVNQPYKGEQIDWQHMMSPSVGSVASENFSVRSATGLEYDDLGMDDNPWIISSPSGYSSLRSSDIEHAVHDYGRPGSDSPLEYQGFEGIYRFLEHCEPSTQVR